MAFSNADKILVGFWIVTAVWALIMFGVELGRTWEHERVCRWQVVNCEVLKDKPY